MKKVFAVLLAVAMVVSLGACRKSPKLSGDDDAFGGSSDYSSDWEWEEETDGGTDADNADGTSSGSTSSKNTSSSTKKPSSSKNEITNTNIDLGITVPKGEFDFGGKTLTIAIAYTSAIPKLGQTAAGDASYYAMHYVMQKYNIGAIDFKMRASGSTAYNSTFIKFSTSGDFWGDIMWCNSDYVKSYIQQDLLQNIEPAKGRLNGQYFSTDCCSVGSGSYGFTGKSAITLRESYLIYNTDLIKKNNLTDPKTVYNNNEWTYEKYREYVRTITDANKDVFGMAIPDFHQLFNAPSDAEYRDQNGKYICAWTDPVRSASRNKLYNWIIDMYNEGSVFGDFIIGQEAINAGQNAFRNGKIGFIMGGNATCKTFKSEGLKNFQIVAAPTEDGSHKYYNSSAHYAFWALPANNANYTTDMLLAVANDLFCTSDPSHGKAYYIQSETELADSMYSDYFISKSDAQYAIELGKCTSTYYGWGIFVNQSFQVAREMLQPVLQGKTTWAKVTAQYAPQRQSDIDKSMNSGLYK